MNDKLNKELQAPFPPEAYKEVKFGRGFTSIDAYHVIDRLNTVFGLCGIGWSVEVKEYVVSGDSVAAIGSLWYVLPQESKTLPNSKTGNLADYAEYQTGLGSVQAVGDATVIKGNVAEAYKKALTNLISKASSYIGVGLDVYMGKHQDDPYLDKVEVTSKEKQAPILSETAVDDDIF